MSKGYTVVGELSNEQYDRLVEKSNTVCENRRWINHRGLKLINKEYKIL